MNTGCASLTICHMDNVLIKNPPVFLDNKRSAHPQASPQGEETVNQLPCTEMDCLYEFEPQT